MDRDKSELSLLSVRPPRFLQTFAADAEAAAIRGSAGR
jgi:hypothetical protein